MPYLQIEDTNAKSAKSPLWAYLLIAVCSFSFMVRYGTGGSFWYDEFAQISFSGAGKTVVESALVLDATPPLFNVLANVWYHLLPYGDRWLLLLPQAFMAAAIVLTGLWGEQFGGRATGVWAALFLGFSQMIMEQCGFEFRGYGSYLMLSAAAFYLHGKRGACEKKSPILYTFVLAGVLYAHLFGSLIVFTLCVWDLYSIIRHRASWKICIPYFFAGVLFLPWVLYFAFSIAAEAAGTPSIWMVKPSLWEAMKLGAYLCGNHIVLCVLCLIGAIRTCGEAFRKTKTETSEKARQEHLLPLFSIAASVVPIYLYGVLRSGYASLWEKRYFTGLFPCVCVLCGYGAATITDTVRRKMRKTQKTAVSAVVTAFLFLTTVPVFMEKTARMDTPLAVYHHREAAEFLRNQPDISDEDVLVLSSLDTLTGIWDLYYGGYGKSIQFDAKGVRALTPDELDRYNVVYYDFGFWPEDADTTPVVQELKRSFRQDQVWEDIQLGRYVKR